MSSNQNEVSEKQVSSEKTEGPSENVAASASLDNADQKAFTSRHEEGKRDFGNQQEAKMFVSELMTRMGSKQTVNYGGADAVSSSSAEQLNSGAQSKDEAYGEVESTRSPSEGGAEAKPNAGAGAYGDEISTRSPSEGGSEAKAGQPGNDGSVKTPKTENDTSAKDATTRGEGESGYKPKTGNRDGETTHNTDESGSRLKPARRPGTF